MTTKKEVDYYQFQKELEYPVFVRFEDSDLELRLEPMLTGMGFVKLKQEELKYISFDKKQTKVLNVQEANFRVSKQIDQAHALDSYGSENLTSLGSYDVYRYKGIGMLIFGEGNYFWELGLKNIESSPMEIKTIFTRFLTWALAPFGVIGFWGVPVDEGVVIMKPKQANFESIFIDIQKSKIMSQDGVKDIKPGFSLLRLDETLKETSRRMSKEALVSFLSTNTSYFSYNGLDFVTREAIYDFAMMVDGYIYPVENFKPRTKLQEV